jgi:hypothetical protein
MKQGDKFGNGINNLTSMKISIDQPNNQILIALMEYNLNANGKDLGKYGFAYFELSDACIMTVNRFLDNWEEGIRDYTEVIISIPESYLLDSSYIFDKTYKELNEDFIGIKLDSINFIEQAPEFDYPIMKECQGKIFLRSSSFIIEGQVTDIKVNYPRSIYLSPEISYWKINHLLKRDKPI